MADKAIEPIAIPIEWRVPEDLKTHYATNLVIQHTNQEFIISFFETKNPIILGTPDEVKSQYEKIKSVKADCVARIVVTPKRMEDFIKVIQTNLDKFHSLLKGKEDGS